MSRTNLIFSLVTGADELESNAVALVEVLQASRDPKTAIAHFVGDALTMYSVSEYKHAKGADAITVSPSESENGIISFAIDKESAFYLEATSLVKHFQNRLSRYIYPRCKAAGLFAGRNRASEKRDAEYYAKRIKALLRDVDGRTVRAALRIVEEK